MSEVEETLLSMNRSELVQIARVAGLGNLSREHEVGELAAAVLEYIVLPEDALRRERELMERHIERFLKRLLSQLPGCNGKCTSYGCPDIIVQRCWATFSRDML